MLPIKRVEAEQGEAEWGRDHRGLVMAMIGLPKLFPVPLVRGEGHNVEIGNHPDCTEDHWWEEKKGDGETIIEDVGHYIDDTKYHGGQIVIIDDAVLIKK